MKMKKIVSLFIIFFLASISFSSVALTQRSDAQETMLLIRISYSDGHLLFIQNQGFDILGIRQHEWIDIFIVESDRSVLEAHDIDYTITIDDVDRYCNSVRGTYHTFPEIETILQDIANNYPSITSLYSIGQSHEGREIWCLEISDNPGVDEDEPGVFYMGLHHAREWPTIEICLHIADELTSKYGSDPDITDVVDNRRLWLVTCENPDGYVYSHDQGHNMWRKNRRYLPQHGTYGIDPNRNYAGSSNGNIDGAWGSIGTASNTHNPSSDTYVGPWAASEPCTQNIVNHFIQEDICALISWHTYSELVLWPWAYSTSEVTPDDTYMSQVGVEIANRITQQDGSGTYFPDQSSGLYPTTGDTTDWAYGYSHYVKGKTCFSYTIEACTSFQPSESYLDQICEENFDGALYLLQEAENIDVIDQRVMPPVLTEMDSDSDGDYIVSWTEQNPDADPEYFQLDELTGLSVELDDAESGSSLWDLEGFTITTARSHSATHSYKADNSNAETSAMTSVYPLPVTSGMNLGFWIWYDIEENYDMGFVEVSTNGRFYDLLDTFNGDSNGWVYQEYSLDNYTGQTIFIRFRHSTDTNTLGSGFFVDDITPIADFSNVNILSDTITTTSYGITGKTPGEYYYRVKGYNSAYGWGDFSILESMNVTGGGSSLSIDNVLSYPPVQETPGWVNISGRITSTDNLNTVTVNITKPDNSTTIHTMNKFANTNVYFYNESYSMNGVYSFIIWARSTSGQKESFRYCFYIGPDFKSIDIYAGWNLITLPVDSNWNASDLAGFIPGCISVSRWDQYLQSYRAFFVGGPDSFDYQLQPGYGYFIETEVSTTFACNGSAIQTVSVPLKIAWDLIGWYQDDATTAKSLSENITGCISVNRWDPVLQSYRAYFVGGPDSFDFTVNPGMGLFVEVDTESIWHGEG